MIDVDSFGYQTLSGGYWNGRRALVVRLGSFALTGKDLDDVVCRESSRFAMIAGPEPIDPLSHQSIEWLIDRLRGWGFFVAVETSGEFAAVPGIDWVICRPRRRHGYRVHPDLLSSVCEYTYTIDDLFDWSILDRHDHQYRAHRYALEPATNRHLFQIIQYQKGNPAWDLNLKAELANI